jgi:transposase
LFPIELLPIDKTFVLTDSRLADDMLVIALTSTRTDISCPLCEQPTQRMHSTYQRTIADLPWGGRRVVLQVTVRKFFCANVSCVRKIFVERLGALAQRYARKTERLLTTLTQLAFGLGGRAGTRHAARLALPSSPNILLRLIKSCPLPPIPTPQVIGIDDWAWKKGNTYGTLIVDLETRRPIDLLPDRNADSVATWLKRHPSIKIVSRDRGGVYADGITRGAPQATQVADRFHLVQNCVAALETFFGRKRAILAAVTEREDAVQQQPRRRKKVTVKPIPQPEPAPLSQAAEAARRANHAQEVARYHHVRKLRAKKYSITRIARTVGVSRPTVYRYVAMSEPPPRRRIAVTIPRVLDPYHRYIIERWNNGCRNAQQLQRELAAAGYPGSARTVTRFVAQLRHDSGGTRSFKAVEPELLYAATSRPQPPMSPRRVAWLLVTHEEKRTVRQQAYLHRLQATDCEIDQTVRDVAAFMQLVRQRRGADLDHWLAVVAEQGVREVQGFARGLRKDGAAVTAGLTLEWSNGQTEAHIGRLKLLKRQSHGQAGIDLLRQRMLHEERDPRIHMQKGRAA